ncbi:hypothetical protein WJX72_000513 [[Myrmecia] bisecta]|uniref:Vacuolar protein sorting-associated protein 28 homolog n=1 Tax=[Myrmecia] bisecta TaxID=41462 RepID=A0AAW1R519_9CHLO
MLADTDPALVRLYINKKERETYENYADLFAILKATEKLERAYVRDAISAKDYEPACEKLIGQFRTLWESLKDTVPDVQQFMANYNMQCPMAAKRLIQSGMPATIEHGKPRTQETSNSAVSIAETVQHFITAMDSIKLGMTAVDQLYPVLNDLMQTLNKVSQLPPDLSGKVRVKGWITKVHTMAASQELTEADARQLLFDLESAYNEFMTTIQQAS